MLRRACALVGAVVLFSGAARADEPSTKKTNDPEPLAVGAAVVPGAVVHGTGHFVAGHKRTAGTLLALQGAGIGATLGGLGVLAASGASRRLIVPSIMVTASGVSLFFATWLADIYGVATPDHLRGEHLGVVPLLETSFGYRYVHDPQFQYRNFLVESLDLRLGAFRLSPEAWFSPDDANQRLRGAIAYRIHGPHTRVREPGGDGSFVDVEGALVRHEYARESFRYWGGEAMVTGRLDLARIGPTLRGAFAEASFGYALQSYEYVGGGADGFDLLLFRSVFGAYLGTRGEAFIVYDHRHDGYAGGFLMSGLGSGVIGSVGVGGRYFFTDELGLALDARTAAAQIIGLSFLVRPAFTPPPASGRP